MQTRSILTILIAFTLILAGGFMSCEGPEGPVGPQGLQGSQGEIGPRGPEGMSGTANCIQCHGASQLIAGKMLQYEQSTHYTGGHYYETRTFCAPCHTSQGYREVLETGAQRTMAEVTDPLPPNCYACHKIHETFTESDWDLTSPTPVTFWLTGETVDLGLGNSCINCHQARIRNLNSPWDPMPPPLDSDTMLYLSTTRYGPHHGSQGMVFSGSGGSENSAAAFDNSLHTSLLTDACYTCHMASFDPESNLGGHQFSVAHGDELNENGCVACHDAGEAAGLITTTQTEIKGLLFDLAGKLMELGMLEDTTGSRAWRTLQDTFPSAHIGALWNAVYIAEDKTYGVHNYKYTKTLLEESLKAIEN